MKSDLLKITRYLDAELKVKKIPDSSKNGLQVKCGHTVNLVGFAVDATLSTFEKAKRAGVDLLIVHHGIYWKKFRGNVRLLKRRANYLKKNGISLYACHLPLDLHPLLGNNAGLADILGLKGVKKFGLYHGKYIGFSGRFRKPATLRGIKKILDRNIKCRASIYNFGGLKIWSMGIVSGGGDAMAEAASKKLDCFLTGEMSHSQICEAKDFKQNLIIAGHYETETVGVKLVAARLKKVFGVQTIFIDDYLKKYLPSPALPSAKLPADRYKGRG